MWEFFRDILLKKDGFLTFMVIDDSESDAPSTYYFNPKKLLYVAGGAFVCLLIVVIMLLRFTPAGATLFYTEDERLRQQAIEVSNRLKALEDSLAIRDQQFSNIKQVISAGEDTTFSGTLDELERNKPVNTDTENQRLSSSSSVELISADQIIASKQLFDVPAFPADFPVEGTLTRGFNSDMQHFGIDIAAKEGAPFKSVADGRVILSEWTLNYGYMISIQHSDGYFSVYKHGSEVFKEKGETVEKGDLLGKVGKSGIISSGSHLHYELWKNGKALNPINFLINNK